MFEYTASLSNLRFHAREEFSFLLGNAEPLECALNVVRYFLPSCASVRSPERDR